MSSSSRMDSSSGPQGDSRPISFPSFSFTMCETLLISKPSQRAIKVVNDDTSEGFVKRMENIDEGIVNNGLHC